MFRYQGIFGNGESSERFTKFLQARVAHTDRYVSQKCTVFRTPYRAILKHNPELLFRDGCHTFQFRCKLSRMEIGFVCFGGTVVPGTDVLTDIKICAPRNGLCDTGIAERNSMVKYEIQSLASSSN